MSDDPEGGSSRSILDAVGDTLVDSHRTGSDDKVQKNQLDQRTFDFFMEDPVFGWVMNDSRLSDQGIEAGIEDILEGLKKEPNLDVFAKSVIEVGKIEDKTPIFNTLLQSVCTAVDDDVKNNEGRKFRKIARAVDLVALTRVLENEDLKQYLRDHNQDRNVNVYDLEVVVAEAIMLEIARVYTDFLGRKNEPPSVN